MAVSGFGVSALSFATVWVTPSGGSIAPRTPADVAPAATAYFGVSAALTAAAVGGYVALGFLPYWRHHSASSLAGTCCSHSAHACIPQLWMQAKRLRGRQEGSGGLHQSLPAAEPRQRASCWAAATRHRMQTLCLATPVRRTGAVSQRQRLAATWICCAGPSRLGPARKWAHWSSSGSCAATGMPLPVA